MSTENSSGSAGNAPSAVSNGTAKKNGGGGGGRRNNNNNSNRSRNNEKNPRLATENKENARDRQKGPSKPTERVAKVNTQIDMRKYERMLNAAHENFSDIPCGAPTEDCVICCKPNDVFGVGPCRHPVCSECAIRMRVLGECKACPVCRAEIEVLCFCVVGNGLLTIEFPLPKTAHPDEDRYGIRFDGPISGRKYEKYLSHVCKICKSDGERLEFPSFTSLRQHIANEHQLSFCHICLENLNLFSRERKTYTRETLQRHIRIGDPEDKSLKGHPKCFFCEQKFFDEEGRYRHLRKEHFFCQFCEQNGTMTNVFFGKHKELIGHYKEAHFPCESEDCMSMGIAFATQWELDLHRTKEHAEKRNLFFDVSSSRRPGNDRPQGRNIGGVNAVPTVAPVLVANPQTPASEFSIVPSAQGTRSQLTYGLRPAYTPKVQDFPSLEPNAPASMVRPSEFPRLEKVNLTAAAPKSRAEEFPALGGSRGSTAPVYAPRTAPKPIEKPKSVEKQKLVDNHRRQTPRSDGYDNDYRFDLEPESLAPAAKPTVQLVSKLPNRQPTPEVSTSSMPTNADFPALPMASASASQPNSIWASANNLKLKKAGGKNVITACKVPNNFKPKENKPRTAPLPDLWPPPRSFEPPPEEPKEEEWKEIPVTKKAKQNKKTPKQALNVVESSDSSDAETEGPKTLKEVGDLVQGMVHKNESTSSGPSQANAESSSDGKKKKNKNKKNKTKGADEEERREEEVTPPVDVAIAADEQDGHTALQTAIGAFKNLPPIPSMSSLLSGLSLASIFQTRQPESPKIENKPQTPLTSMAAPPGLSFGPPPGLENVQPKGLPTNIATNSFASAPFLSHSDLERQQQKPAAVEQQTDPGWTTTVKTTKKNIAK